MFAKVATYLTILLSIFTVGLSSEAQAAGPVTIYSSRNSDADLAVINKYAKEAGIEVNMVSGKAGELVQKLEAEQAAPVADLFITVDGGLLDSVKQKGLLQPLGDKTALQNVPAALRDRDSHWVGLTTRARVIVYSKERVKPEQLSTYEDLADPKWKGKVVMRPGSALYNVSLMATLIELDGEKAAAEWVKGVASNFAREPKGGDRGQAKDIVAGTGDVTLMNTYYIGRMLNGKDEEEKKAAQNVGVFFPNQKTGGTHINICGIGVVKNAPNKAGAEKLVTYLTGAPAQGELSAGNYEYPVNPKAKKAPLLEEWGTFRAQELDFAVMNKNGAKAKELLLQGGWE